MNDIARHVTGSDHSWSCIPLPEHITSIPDDPFAGMSVRTVVDAPPQLIAHILRMKANRNVQILSPKAVPMLATIERIDPKIRQADHIVVTTQASANTSWPTVDGRDLENIFPMEPNRSEGADASQVCRTRTRPIGKTVAESVAPDPISRAIVRAASVIDVQRRSDVSGDADVLAEILDAAWRLPLGTFGTLAPLVLSSSRDLVRTAISSDHNAPDALMAIQRKKVIHVHGGITSRESYGADIAVDWSRQRAIARSIFNLSCSLEGINLLPTTRTWAAADVRAPIHSNDRDKFLVFQPCYGSGLSVDPNTFRFVRPLNMPNRFAHCYGMAAARVAVTEDALDKILSDMIEAGLPKVAAASVKETFRLDKVLRLVVGTTEGTALMVRGADAGTLYKPRRAALNIASAEMTLHLSTKLARGKTPVRVLRSRIYDVLASIDSASVAPVFRFMKVLKDERYVYGLTGVEHKLILQIATRLSHTLGSIVVHSMALEASRCGSTYEEWTEIAASILPKALRVDQGTNLGWAIIAVWSMWNDTTGRWTNALRIASHDTMMKMAKMEMNARFVTLNLEVEDPVMEAAKIVLSACKAMFAPYYESMYDYYAIIAQNSDELIPLGVGGVQLPFRILDAKRRASICAYVGACLWQLRGRHLRSAYLKKIPLGAPHEKGMEGRVNVYDYEIAIMVAPNRAYEAFRDAVRQFVEQSEMEDFPDGSRGDVRLLIQQLKTPVLADVWDVCEGMFAESRLGRYMADPDRWVADLKKTYDEVSAEIIRAAVSVRLRTQVSIKPTIRAGINHVRYLEFPPAEEVLAEIEEAAAVDEQPIGEFTITVSENLARSETPSDAAKTGWTHMADVYGAEMTELIEQIESMASEEEVDELMMRTYLSQEEFLAALDKFYGGDDVPRETGVVGTTSLVL